MSSKDFYKILGISREANAEEIKKAYKKLALKYHPNFNKDKSVEGKFKEITEAYNVLSDPKKKSNYDTTGSEDNSFGSGFGGFNEGFSGFSGGQSSDSFSDFFSDMFGFGNTRRSTSHINGIDLSVKITLSLEEVFTGTTKDVLFNGFIACKSCKGKGSFDEPKKCGPCNGKGMRQTSTGFMYVSQTCEYCFGAGISPGDPCKACSGYGRLKGKKNITLEIPRSVKQDEKVLFRDKGESGGRGGRAGNLIIIIDIKKHSIFTRDHNDLSTKVNFSLKDMVLGGIFQIKGIDNNNIDVRINASSSPNDKIIIKNQGLHYGGRRGDLIIVPSIKIPKINTQAKEKFLDFWECIS